MTHTMRGSIGTLRAAMNGPVIGPADPDYDRARRVWNADIDRYPAVIARCASPADVAAAVTFAATNGLEITVRGGAHSMSGAAVADRGLMIDLSQLNQVSVDPQAKRARAGGGALLAGLDAVDGEGRLRRGSAAAGPGPAFPGQPGWRRRGFGGRRPR